MAAIGFFDWTKNLAGLKMALYQRTPGLSGLFLHRLYPQGTSRFADTKQ
jgi:hypothetical protein